MTTRTENLRELLREIPGMLDAVVYALAPARGRRRAAERAKYERLYEAGSVSNQHKSPQSAGFSPDAVVGAESGTLRGWGRYLDENYDVAISVLDNLTTGCVGTGLVFEPQVRTRAGELHKPTNDMLRKAWRDWWEYPEVTRELAGPDMERLICRTWLRDGEILIHHLEGNRRGLHHWTNVPYSLELLEADFLPYDLLTDVTDSGRIVHGVEKDAFGRPVAYHIYRHHPGNDPFTNLQALVQASSTKRVLADRVTHLKFSRRIRQTRGVTALHGVIHRLDDLKDGDDSERIAQRIAAAFSAAITKNIDMDVDTVDASGDRSFQMQPGMIFDRLQPGENVEVIGSSRPNPNLVPFRADQIRGVTGGTGAGYSAVSRHFDTSYAAQRAESVTLAPLEQSLSGYFCRSAMKPIWRRFVGMAIAGGVVPLRMSMIDPDTLMECDIRRGGGTPWIDPSSDIKADIDLIDSELVSRQYIQRKRGIDPEQMRAEIEAERALAPDPVTPEPPEVDDNDETDAA